MWSEDKKRKDRGRNSGRGGRMGGDEFEMKVPEWIFEGLDFKKRKE